MFYEVKKRAFKKSISDKVFVHRSKQALSNDMIELVNVILQQNVTVQNIYK